MLISREIIGRIRATLNLIWSNHHDNKALPIFVGGLIEALKYANKKITSRDDFQYIGEKIQRVIASLDKIKAKKLHFANLIRLNAAIKELESALLELKKHGEDFPDLLTKLPSSEAKKLFFEKTPTLEKTDAKDLPNLINLATRYAILKMIKTVKTTTRFTTAEKRQKALNKLLEQYEKITPKDELGTAPSSTRPMTDEEAKDPFIEMGSEQEKPKDSFKVDDTHSPRQLTQEEKELEELLNSFSDPSADLEDTDKFEQSATSTSEEHDNELLLMEKVVTAAEEINTWLISPPNRSKNRTWLDTGKQIIIENSKVISDYLGIEKKASGAAVIAKLFTRFQSNVFAPTEDKDIGGIAAYIYMLLNEFAIRETHLILQTDLNKLKQVAISLLGDKQRLETVIYRFKAYEIIPRAKGLVASLKLLKEHNLSYNRNDNLLITINRDLDNLYQHIGSTYIDSAEKSAILENFHACYELIALKNLNGSSKDLELLARLAVVIEDLSTAMPSLIDRDQDYATAINNLKKLTKNQLQNKIKEIKKTRQAEQKALPQARPQPAAVAPNRLNEFKNAVASGLSKLSLSIRSSIPRPRQAEPEVRIIIRDPSKFVLGEGEVEITAMANGDCFFNAYSLGFIDLFLRGKLNTLFEQGKFKGLMKELRRTSNMTDARLPQSDARFFLSYLRRHKNDHANLQRYFAIALRNYTLEAINKQNIGMDGILPTLQVAYNDYKVMADFAENKTDTDSFFNALIEIAKTKILAANLTDFDEENAKENNPSVDEKKQQAEEIAETAATRIREESKKSVLSGLKEYVTWVSDLSDTDLSASLMQALEGTSIADKKSIVETFIRYKNNDHANFTDSSIFDRAFKELYEENSTDGNDIQKLEEQFKNPASDIRKEYLKKKATSGTWADQHDITALSEILPIKICIAKVDVDTIEKETPYGSAANSLTIRIGHSLNHFNPLVDRDSADKIITGDYSNVPVVAPDVPSDANSKKLSEEIILTLPDEDDEEKKRPAKPLANEEEVNSSKDDNQAFPETSEEGEANLPSDDDDLNDESEGESEGSEGEKDPEDTQPTRPLSAANVKHQRKAAEIYLAEHKRIIGEAITHNRISHDTATHTGVLTAAMVGAGATGCLFACFMLVLSTVKGIVAAASMLAFWGGTVATARVLAHYGSKREEKRNGIHKDNALKLYIINLIFDADKLNLHPDLPEIGLHVIDHLVNEISDVSTSRISVSEGVTNEDFLFDLIIQLYLAEEEWAKRADLTDEDKKNYKDHTHTEKVLKRAAVVWEKKYSEVKPEDKRREHADKINQLFTAPSEAKPLLAQTTQATASSTPTSSELLAARAWVNTRKVGYNSAMVAHRKKWSTRKKVLAAVIGVTVALTAIACCVAFPATLVIITAFIAAPAIAMALGASISIHEARTRPTLTPEKTLHTDNHHTHSDIKIKNDLTDLLIGKEHNLVVSNRKGDHDTGLNIVMLYQRNEEKRQLVTECAINVYLDCDKTKERMSDAKNRTNEVVKKIIHSSFSKGSSPSDLVDNIRHLLNQPPHIAGPLLHIFLQELYTYTPKETNFETILEQVFLGTNKLSAAEQAKLVMLLPDEKTEIKPYEAVNFHRSLNDMLFKTNHDAENGGMHYMVNHYQMHGGSQRRKLETYDEMPTGENLKHNSKFLLVDKVTKKETLVFVDGDGITYETSVAESLPVGTEMPALDKLEPYTKFVVWDEKHEHWIKVYLDGNRNVHSIAGWTPPELDSDPSMERKKYAQEWVESIAPAATTPEKIAEKFDDLIEHFQVGAVKPEDAIDIFADCGEALQLTAKIDIRNLISIKSQIALLGLLQKASLENPDIAKSASTQSLQKNLIANLETPEQKLLQVLRNKHKENNKQYFVEVYELIDSKTKAQPAKIGEFFTKQFNEPRDGKTNNFDASAIAELLRAGASRDHAQAALLVQRYLNGVLAYAGGTSENLETITGEILMAYKKYLGADYQTAFNQAVDAFYGNKLTAAQSLAIAEAAITLGYTAPNSNSPLIKSLEENLTKSIEGNLSRSPSMWNNCFTVFAQPARNSTSNKAVEEKISQQMQLLSRLMSNVTFAEMVNSVFSNNPEKQYNSIAKILLRAISSIAKDASTTDEQKANLGAALAKITQRVNPKNKNTAKDVITLIGTCEEQLGSKPAESEARPEDVSDLITELNRRRAMLRGTEEGETSDEDTESGNDLRASM